MIQGESCLLSTTYPSIIVTVPHMYVSKGSVLTAHIQNSHSDTHMCIFTIIPLESQQLNYGEIPSHLGAVETDDKSATGTGYPDQ